MIIILCLIVLELMYTLTVDAGVNPPLLFVNVALEETILTGSVTLGPMKTFDTITHTIYTEVCINSVYCKCYQFFTIATRKRSVQECSDNTGCNGK